tara:strand:- start:281 stop:409 length:129 start_codon:yes stop_codon:yes gene_type:complete
LNGAPEEIDDRRSVLAIEKASLIQSNSIRKPLGMTDLIGKIV